MVVIAFPENLKTTSGFTLSNLLHGVISLPDATSCDKVQYSALKLRKMNLLVLSKFVRKIHGVFPCLTIDHHRNAIISSYLYVTADHHIHSLPFNHVKNHLLNFGSTKYIQSLLLTDNFYKDCIIGK